MYLSAVLKNTWCLREVDSVKPRPKILIRTLAKLVGKILRLWEERIKVPINNRQKEGLHNGLCSWVGPRRFFLKGEAWPILIWYPPRQRDEQPVELSRGLHEFSQWPEKAFSLLKEPNCTFTVKNLWRNYAKVALSKHGEKMWNLVACLKRSHTTADLVSRDSLSCPLVLIVADKHKASQFTYLTILSTRRQP